MLSGREHCNLLVGLESSPPGCEVGCTAILLLFFVATAEAVAVIAVAAAAIALTVSTALAGTHREARKAVGVTPGLEVDLLPSGCNSLGDHERVNRRSVTGAVFPGGNGALLDGEGPPVAQLRLVPASFGEHLLVVLIKVRVDTRADVGLYSGETTAPGLLAK